jgi:hypothetical protein
MSIKTRTSSRSRRYVEGDTSGGAASAAPAGVSRRPSQSSLQNRSSRARGETLGCARDCPEAESAAMISPAVIAARAVVTGSRSSRAPAGRPTSGFGAARRPTEVRR